MSTCHRRPRRHVRHHAAAQRTAWGPCCAALGLALLAAWDGRPAYGNLTGPFHYDHPTQVLLAIPPWAGALCAALLGLALWLGASSGRPGQRRAGGAVGCLGLLLALRPWPPREQVLITCLLLSCSALSWSVLATGVPGEASSPRRRSGRHRGWLPPRRAPIDAETSVLAPSEASQLPAEGETPEAAQPVAEDRDSEDGETALHRSPTPQGLARGLYKLQLLVQLGLLACAGRTPILFVDANRCLAHQRLIAAALVLYARQHQGVYPKDLSGLVPGALRAVPPCLPAISRPAAWLYTGAYGVSFASYTYTRGPRGRSFSLGCAGHNHLAAGVAPGFPRVRSTGTEETGLLAPNQGSSLTGRR